MMMKTNLQRDSQFACLNRDRTEMPQRKFQMSLSSSRLAVRGPENDKSVDPPSCFAPAEPNSNIKRETEGSPCLLALRGA